MHRRFIALTAMLLATAAPASAQEPPRAAERLTGIVAVVGDSVVTDLDMAESFQLWEAEQQRARPDPGTTEYDQVFATLLEDRITTLLLVQAALQDTAIKVTDEEVDRLTQQQMDTVRSQFPGGQADFERALRQANFTPEAYRENLRVQIRRSRLASAYLAKVRRDRKPPPVSDAEIRDFFAQQGAQIPMLPPAIVFEQIVIPVQASDSARATARAKADSILAAIRGGESFEDMARRFSEDGSRDFGGDLGWFRPGQMVPEFERATYLLKTGEISEPVRTVYGYHLIKLEKIRGPERSARHILIRPVLTEGDTERARALASEVGSKWRAGASLDSLRRAHGDRDELSRVGPIPRDSLQGGFRDALRGAAVGQVTEPFETGQDRGTPQFVVARVAELTEARPATVDDYRTIIQGRIADRKLNEEIVAELRRKTYIEIRKPGSEPDR